MQDPGQFNWDDLRVVLAIARSGSLTQAAGALGIDQSTVGRRLTMIEADLGATLFLRARTGLSLTEAGETVVARATEIEGRTAGLIQDIARAEDGVSGAVRVNGPHWVLALLTRHALPQLLADHPRLQIRFVSVRRENRPPLGLDPTVSLYFADTTTAPEFAVKLGTIPYALYRAKTVPEAEDRWITFFDETAPRRNPFRGFEKLRKPSEPLVYTATDASTLEAAVRAGIGKGILPMCMADGQDDLVRIGDGKPDMALELYMHLHPDSVQLRRVQTVIRWLREVFPETFLGTR